MNYTVAAYTDIGIQKPTNQDSICVRRAAIPDGGETVLAVVCDGMGGLKKGEVASAAVVNAFGKWFDENLSRLPLLCGSTFMPLRHQWEVLIDTLHQTMRRYSAENSVQLGTTVSAFFAYTDHYLTMTVGDSRIYERNNALKQLTQDQSLVAREVAAGRISEEESRHHPQRNVLLQCIGTGCEHIVPVFTEGRVRDNTIYLLCTDGFVHEPSHTELENVFQPLSLNSKEAITNALYQITELCKNRGETDNITAVLLKANESLTEKTIHNGFFRLFQTSRIQKKPVEKPTLQETAQIVHTSEEIGRY